MPRVVPGYTIEDVTSADFSGITITKQSDGAGGSVLMATGSYKVRTNPANASTPDQRFSSVTVTLSAAQATALRTFITNNLVAPANQQEA